MHLIGMFVVWLSKVGRSFFEEEMKDSGAVVVGCANG
jgi:hypothetical protein